jgi:cell division septum initiation protein DivIVA
MTLVDPIEREALIFAVLRERACAIEAVDDVERRLQRADAEITEWLHEAEEEGARILERARAEAEQVRSALAEEVGDLLRDVQSLHDRLAALAARAQGAPHAPEVPAPRRSSMVARLLRRPR